MESMGDSYSDLMQRLQSSLGASSLAQSTCDRSSFLQPNQAQSELTSSSQPVSAHQSQTIPRCFSAQGLPPSHPSSKHLLLQPSFSQMPSHSQPRSLLQPNSQPVPPAPLPSHSRSLSQPAFFAHNFSQAPPFTSIPVSQPFPSARNSLPRSFLDGFPSFSSFPVKTEASTPSTSDPGSRAAISIEVSMNDQESSPGPSSISGPSVPPLPPLSPSMAPYHSSTGRCSTDLNKFSENPSANRGHRRAHSDVLFSFSAVADSQVDRHRGQSGPDKEIARGEEGGGGGEAVKDAEKDIYCESLTGVDRKVKKELDWDKEIGAETMMEVVDEKEGEDEGGDDIFSMYMDMDKIDGFHNSGNGDLPERTEQRLRGKCGNADFLEKAGEWENREKGKGRGSRTDQASSRNEKDTEKGPGSSEKGEAFISSHAEHEKENESLQEGTGENETGGSKDEMSRMEGHGNSDADAREEDRTAANNEQKTKTGSLLESESSFSHGSSHHFRSASMDSFVHSLKGGEDGQQMSPSQQQEQQGHQSSVLQGRKVRHSHSHSMDGSVSMFGNGDFDPSEMKKIMGNDKLTEIALLDPKRAKRILANRQSAARSKERKMRYISELERKVQTLQTEATALSAQLTLLQRDSTGLSNENSELKLRVQAMEQQGQLRDALNDALREEVHRLKLVTGEMGGQQIPLNQQHFQRPQHQQQGSHLTLQQQIQNHHHHQQQQQQQQNNNSQQQRFAGVQTRW